MIPSLDYVEIALRIVSENIVFRLREHGSHGVNYTPSIPSLNLGNTSVSGAELPDAITTCQVLRTTGFRLQPATCECTCLILAHLFWFVKVDFDMENLSCVFVVIRSDGDVLCFLRHQHSLAI
jgi:hypothetical protein